MLLLGTNYHLQVWLGFFSEFVFCFQKYKEFERFVRVEEMDGLRLVKRLAKDMEEMFHKKAQAMKV